MKKNIPLRSVDNSEEKILQELQEPEEYLVLLENERKEPEEIEIEMENINKDKKGGKGKPPKGYIRKLCYTCRKEIGYSKLITKNKRYYKDIIVFCSRKCFLDYLKIVKWEEVKNEQLPEGNSTGTKSD